MFSYSLYFTWYSVITIWTSLFVWWHTIRNERKNWLRFVTHIFISGTDLVSSYRYSSCCFCCCFFTCWGDLFIQKSKKPKAPSFQIGSGWNLAGIFFLYKYASIDGVGFSLWHHNFKPAAMTSFHAENCFHLVSEHEASARRLCSSVRQFLIYSTFITCFYIRCITQRGL